jgi:chromate transport protein ChrA
MAWRQKQDPEAIRRRLARIGQAVAVGGALAIACLVSYALITHLLSQAYFISQDDGLLGGMWAVVATVFVYRLRYHESRSAALSRMAATLLSFVLCLVYLLIFPFSAWGMAALIGIGAMILTLRQAGRHDHDRNHNHGRDGRGRHQPAARLETAHPALSRHRCWDRSRYGGRSDKPDHYIGYRPHQRPLGRKRAAPSDTG